MSSDELGKLVRALTNVPCDRHEIVGDILARLSGKEGRYWRHVYMRVNQRKNPFNNVDPEVLEPVSGMTTQLYGQSLKSAARRGGFVPMTDDPNSPFGSCELLVTPAASTPTRTITVQGYNIRSSTTYGELIKAVGGEEEIRSMHLLTPTQIRLMVERQRKGLLESGEKGPLDLHEDSHFFMLAEDGFLVVATVNWGSGFRDWNLWVHPVKLYQVIPQGSKIFLRIK